MKIDCIKYMHIDELNDNVSFLSRKTMFKEMETLGQVNYCLIDSCLKTLGMSEFTVESFLSMGANVGGLSKFCWFVGK